MVVKDCSSIRVSNGIGSITIAVAVSICTGIVVPVIASKIGPAYNIWSGCISSCVKGDVVAVVNKEVLCIVKQVVKDQGIVAHMQTNTTIAVVTILGTGECTIGAVP